MVSIRANRKGDVIRYSVVDEYADEGSHYQLPKRRRFSRKPLRFRELIDLIERPTMPGGGPWHLAWYDEAGRRRTRSSRTTDRRAAERILAKNVADIALRRDGVVDPQQDGYSEANRRPLSNHLDDYRADLIARGNTPKYAAEVHSQALRATNLANAERIGDLRPAPIQAALKQLRDDGLSLRTLNKGLRAVKQFSRWLHRNKRGHEHTLATLKTFNEDTDKRHRRRELPPEDLNRLIEAAEHAAPVLGMEGTDLAAAYRLAAGTGFRADELCSLTPQSFNLDANPPTVTVEAGFSKHRRDDVQPIRRDLAELLRPWLARNPP